MIFYLGLFRFDKGVQRRNRQWLYKKSHWWTNGTWQQSIPGIVLHYSPILWIFTNRISFYHERKWLYVVTKGTDLYYWWYLRSARWRTRWTDWRSDLLHGPSQPETSGYHWRTLCNHSGLYSRQQWFLSGLYLPISEWERQKLCRTGYQRYMRPK